MAARPGRLNLITDVPGIAVGNAEDHAVLTGVTVIVPDSRAVAAVSLRGGAPGTRETDALAPENLVDAVDAIVLSGGSVYGLDAAGAVAAELGAQCRGYALAGSSLVAPVVPAAILFDLTNGGDKAWGREPPYRRLGAAALTGAAAQFALGNAGAGLGARAGLYKGGLGSASVVTDDGLIVGALVAANAFGSPVIPGTRTLWAWTFEQGDELGGQEPPPKGHRIDLDLPDDTKRGPIARTNTSIGVVACNAALTPAEAKRVAIMASDGYARACRPMHTAMDGDAVFVLATGAVELPEPRPLMVSRIGMLAADCAARAFARGIYEARTIGALTSYRDSFR
jgi:L-aminopeptidase/D-esterase-like protein